MGKHEESQLVESLGVYGLSKIVSSKGMSYWNVDVNLEGYPLV